MGNSGRWGNAKTPISGPREIGRVGSGSQIVILESPQPATVSTVIPTDAYTLRNQFRFAKKESGTVKR